MTQNTASTTPSTPPVIQINGDNPAVIHIGDTYADLGATITGPQADLNLGIKTFLNGRLVSNIVLEQRGDRHHRLRRHRRRRPHRHRHPHGHHPSRKGTLNRPHGKCLDDDNHNSPMIPRLARLPN